jgi:hypothetical protein
VERHRHDPSLEEWATDYLVHPLHDRYVEICAELWDAPVPDDQSDVPRARRDPDTGTISTPRLSPVRRAELRASIEATEQRLQEFGKTVDAAARRQLVNEYGDEAESFLRLLDRYAAGSPPRPLTVSIGPTHPRRRHRPIDRTSDHTRQKAAREGDGGGASWSVRRAGAANRIDRQSAMPGSRQPERSEVQEASGKVRNCGQKRTEARPVFTANTVQNNSPSAVLVAQRTDDGGIEQRRIRLSNECLAWGGIPRESWWRAFS